MKKIAQVVILVFVCLFFVWLWDEYVHSFLPDSLADKDVDKIIIYAAIASNFVALLANFRGATDFVSEFLFLKKGGVKEIDWREIELGVDALSPKVLFEFNPDIILTLSQGGSIVANYMHNRYAKNIVPIISIVCYQASNAMAQQGNANFINIVDSKCIFQIPESIFKNPAARIAIVDDTAITGDLLEKLLTKFRERDMMNYKTFVLYALDSAIKAGKAGDVWWKELEHTKYRLPWGSIYGIADPKP